ncbi:WhiB family transcriptional regulator [Streptomyces sp. TRM76323]|uniref:WhiB family transcriptional regulator n=1 Tax=Streptomyces tamarix TaxID=3078565 RepID=A0ABU3QG34_9ACTN|nr:WhiB family transcriptional regulator [Streptomyces tamarix]MDT9681720.1 WhiB family transcriptional regulator [Streptomyces tamarix]
MTAPSADTASAATTGTPACAGLPPHVVFARRAADAAPALRACARCPVIRRCEEVVDPAHTWFDGVSAGRLWRNGRPVDLDRGRRRRAGNRGAREGLAGAPSRPAA